MADHVSNRPIMHCKPLSMSCMPTDCVSCMKCMAKCHVDSFKAGPYISSWPKNLTSLFVLNLVTTGSFLIIFLFEC